MNQQLPAYIQSYKDSLMAFQTKITSGETTSLEEASGSLDKHQMVDLEATVNYLQTGRPNSFIGKDAMDEAIATWAPSVVQIAKAVEEKHSSELTSQSLRGLENLQAKYRNDEITTENFSKKNLDFSEGIKRVAGLQTRSRLNAESQRNANIIAAFNESSQDLTKVIAATLEEKKQVTAKFDAAYDQVAEANRKVGVNKTLTNDMIQKAHKDSDMGRKEQTVKEQKTENTL